MRPTVALVALLVVVPLAAAAASARPALEVLSPAPRVGDHTMVVAVGNVTLMAPGGSLGENATSDQEKATAFLEYRLNGAPCAAICAHGAPYRTTATTFTFANLQAGDRVSVEVLQANGTSYDPPVLVEQGVRLQSSPNEQPAVAIRTSTPNAGDYIMEAVPIGFTVVAPTPTPLPQNRTSGHFLYTLNGVPCTGNCSGGAPAATGADKFVFHGLKLADRVAVELVNHDGTSYNPARRAVQVVTAPKITVGSGVPRAGQAYDINVTVSGFTLAEPVGQPRSAGTGHLHYLVCERAERTNDFEACKQAPGDSMTSDTAFRYTGLEEGQILIVELVHNDHTPLDPPVRGRVDVEDAAPQDPLAPGVGPALALGLLAAAALVRRRKAA
ncbi:MAG: hypothetical protein QOD77_1379 [Thermoplasmata archaeon]|jgi:uncharacterized protein (TIGR03382 family)|nr:hypothetical protein [Thermoplasmata archaeon]